MGEEVLAEIRVVVEDGFKELYPELYNADDQRISNFVQAQLRKIAKRNEGLFPRSIGSHFTANLKELSDYPLLVAKNSKILTTADNEDINFIVRTLREKAKCDIKIGDITIQAGKKMNIEDFLKLTEIDATSFDSASEVVEDFVKTGKGQNPVEWTKK